jgi:hypothetical protein
MFTIQMAMARDREAVESLRLVAYRAAKEFYLGDELSLKWSADDDAIVLGAWDQDQLVSTTGGTVLAGPRSAQAFMECDISAVPISYPTCSWARARPSRHTQATAFTRCCGDRQVSFRPRSA